MSVSAPAKRPSVGARRAGYLVAVLVNAAMLWAVNLWPGWDVVPFLTEEAAQVVSAVNATLAVSLAVNGVYLLRDPTWLRSVGDVVTLGVGVVVLVRIWQVFPFDLDSAGLDWALVVRVLLVLGIVGSVIGMFAALATLVRGEGRS